MKVTICTLNTQYIHSSLAPFCLLAGLKKYADKDISAEVIQGTINENINDFSQKIIQKKASRSGAFVLYLEYRKNVSARVSDKERAPGHNNNNGWAGSKL